MIDSVLTRVLCHRVGIFDLRQESTIHLMLDSFCRHKPMEAEQAVEYLIQRWEDYLSCAADLQWHWGSPYSFFMSGKYDRRDAWPWKEEKHGPDPYVGMYRPGAIQ